MHSSVSPKATNPVCRCGVYLPFAACSPVVQLSAMMAQAASSLPQTASGMVPATIYCGKEPAMS